MPRSGSGAITITDITDGIAGTDALPVSLKTTEADTKTGTLTARPSGNNEWQIITAGFAVATNWDTTGNSPVSILLISRDNADIDYLNTIEVGDRCTFNNEQIGPVVFTVDSITDSLTDALLFGITVDVTVATPLIDGSACTFGWTKFDVAASVGAPGSRGAGRFDASVPYIGTTVVPTSLTYNDLTIANEAAVGSGQWSIFSSLVRVTDFDLGVTLLDLAYVDSNANDRRTLLNSVSNGDTIRFTSTESGKTGTVTFTVSSVTDLDSFGLDIVRFGGTTSGSITGLSPDDNMNVNFDLDIDETIVAPTVGDGTFNDDALQTVCVANQGTYDASNNTCSVELGEATEGDTSVLTYLEFASGNIPTGLTAGVPFTRVLTDAEAGNIVSSATRGAIHDGTGNADNDWTGFAVQIDGSLLVQGTVVAEALNIGDAFSVDSGGNLIVSTTALQSSATIVNPVITQIGGTLLGVNFDSTFASYNNEVIYSAFAEGSSSLSVTGISDISISFASITTSTLFTTSALSATSDYVLDYNLELIDLSDDSVINSSNAQITFTQADLNGLITNTAATVCAPGFGMTQPGFQVSATLPSRTATLDGSIGNITEADFNTTYPSGVQLRLRSGEVNGFGVSTLGIPVNSHTSVFNLFGNCSEAVGSTNFQIANNTHNDTLTTTTSGAVGTITEMAAKTSQNANVLMSSDRAFPTTGNNYALRVNGGRGFKGSSELVFFGDSTSIVLTFAQAPADSLYVLIDSAQEAHTLFVAPNYTGGSTDFVQATVSSAGVTFTGRSPGYGQAVTNITAIYRIT